MAFNSGLIALSSPGPIGLQKCLDGGFCALFNVRLRKVGADAEDYDVEEIGFDEFLKLARCQGHVVDGEFAGVDVFLQNFGRQNFTGLGA